ncbi:MAG: phenylalanine--tRNA ligase subunit alpha [Hyphomicrobiales bacterium]|nr:phenylalanine--tRNA ligase subunit alpha [Rickettsiales bacterium]MCP5361515.1 phenylalanine--tRNA ligase subunit alpha [Hyphomicrobiales bacterium]
MSLADKDLAALSAEASGAVRTATTLDALEAVRIAYLGKSGKLTEQLKQLGSLPPEERKTAGAALNQVKQVIAEAIAAAKESLENIALSAALEQDRVDITLPARSEKPGSIHPISQVIEECTELFGAMGFTVAEGPEIEDDWHNFTALNIPESHPARQMHDTFYFPADAEGNSKLLRTHTSPVQIRTMQAGKPPFRFIAPGRTYRCDSDITHSPMFHQIEGLYIDKNIHMGHLKGCLTQFVQTFFGVSEVPVRFRPSFFPFTEPSAEMDIGCIREGGELKIGAGKDWLEILGCGMVHPAVLRNVGLDPEEWQGFAFGMGVERLAMLKYGIPDLRTFFDSDVRWLNHYGFAPLDIPTLVRGLAR